MFRQSRHAFLDDRAGTRLDDSGMATIESAVLVLVFALFAGVMWMITQSGSVRQAIADLVDQALKLSG